MFSGRESYVVWISIILVGAICWMASTATEMGLFDVKAVGDRDEPVVELSFEDLTR